MLNDARDADQERLEQCSFFHGAMNPETLVH